jgi:N-formylglutamate amidohydrolase
LLLLVGAVAAVAADVPAPSAAPPPPAESEPAAALPDLESPAPAGMVSSLIVTQLGECPIIISAPHGGTAKIPGVSLRKGVGLEKGPAGFFTGRDGGTEELAQEIATEIAAKTGKKPYLVVARFARTYTDANRPPEIAYEDPDAKPVYDEYHALLTQYCRDVKKKFGRGLLIDVHGQGQSAETIYRGTNNGNSVKLLRERFGEAAHTGDKSMFGLLAANGCTVYPTQPGVKEKEGLSGGYITKHYGSSGGFGIDSMQFEFGMKYRAEAARKDTAKKVTAAVAAFSDLYLTDKN